MNGLGPRETVIYNKKFVFGLCPQSLTQGFRNPYKFLSEKSTRSIFCLIEGTLSGLPMVLGRGCSLKRASPGTWVAQS